MRIKFQTPSALRNIPARVSGFITRIETHRLLSRVPKKLIRPGLAIIVLVVLGSAIYFPVAALKAKSTSADTETLQTTTARTGELVIYASGSGTLIPADEVDLAFKTSGQVEAIYFDVGELVEKGNLLAEVDDSAASIKYTQAKRNLLELTSAAAVASAEEAVAAAQSDLDSTNNHLAYVISPEVFRWELEVEKSEQAVEDAKAALETSPQDEDLHALLEKAEAYLDFAEDRLEGNRYYYEHEYLPNNFTTWDKETGTKYVAAPSDTEIMEARAAVTRAEATLQEAHYLYAALTGGEVPTDATGSGLSELESAQLELESAQVTLDGTGIYTPISGTIMSMELSVGDTVGTTTVITVADLSQYYLETFLDETDWPNIAVGYETEIVFDAMPEKTFAGEVVQVDPGLYTSGNTSVVRAIVKLNESSDELNLPIGTAAAVDVIGGRAENAVLIPIEALHKAGDQYTVFVLEDGELRLRVVEVGIQDLLYAEIKTGLAAGEVVSTGIAETQ
jgi:macrolide-specific efflux system membrane fusion protein